MTTHLTRADFFGGLGQRTVRRAGLAGDLATADWDIFTIANAPVLVTSLFGHVTTIIAGAATPQLVFTPTGGADVDLCVAAASIDTDAVNTVYGWDGLAASTLIPSATLGAAGIVATTIFTGPKFFVPGVIHVANAGAASTGVIDWYITYIPLPSNGIITVA